MLKLTVLFASFTKDQLGKDGLLNLEKAIRQEFCAAYQLALSEVTFAYGTAHTGRYDIVIAYDQIPNHVINAVSKMKKLEPQLSETLREIIPPSCCYGGKLLLCSESQLRDLSRPEEEPSEQDEYQKMARQFEPQQPKFTFDRLVLADDVKQQILEAIAIIENRDLLFRQWGLGSIMSPAVLLNLYGSSGTGKTMAAEAIAHRMGKPIIRASYADIESKYHGEGPKRLKGLFLAAKQGDAVLFIDEADSMLSARLSNVTQGSEQAINSMRSQLLMSLENHDGIVIFATNLIENYDQAFLTRLVCIEMKRPDAKARQQIWRNHLYPVEDGITSLRIPLASNVDLEKLAQYDFCGRDIRNAVKRACVMTVLQGGRQVTQQILDDACQRIRDELDALAVARHHGSSRPVPERERQELGQKIASHLTEKA